MVSPVTAAAEGERRSRFLELVSQLPKGVTLVVVTKSVDPTVIRQVIEAGATDIGENRVQEAAVKKAQLANLGVRWHLIGRLQRNKVVKAVELFDVIHSVDSVELAEAVAQAASRLGKVQDILLQVNVSGEPTKGGFLPERVETALDRIRSLAGVRVQGLMTIAPRDGEAVARPVFRQLKALADNLKLEWLSMGMSEDYQVALEEGANIIRIGRRLFGPFPTPHVAPHITG